MVSKSLKICTVLIIVLSQHSCERTPSEFSNSLNMRFVLIEPGAFMMGQESGGDFDEIPVHRVSINKEFYMSVTEVTNIQFEKFDPRHRIWRGQHGLSREDNDAVVNVSWDDASQFCAWLSSKEGIHYRLPTEAEWEYACRAGTQTNFFTGDTLPAIFQKSQKNSWDFQPVSLLTGANPANPWGLHDMHGNVEEWCMDWYGPYEKEEQINPSGRIDGDFKVTRGGSHNTDIVYLRSANRAGTLPEDRNVVIGFRVVRADPVEKNYLPVPPEAQWATEVTDKVEFNHEKRENLKPFFTGPERYVIIDADSKGPLFSNHNHCPDLAVCSNGDLLAVWYTTITEAGRELALAASRWRHDTGKWDPAAPFWDAPDRNDHATALWWDGNQTIYNFNGLSSDATWGKLALILRQSKDNAKSWTKAKIINAEHGLRNMPIAGVVQTEDRALVLKCDAVTGGHGGTAVHISQDGGSTWHDPGAGQPAPEFEDGKTGAWIAGIHAGLVQLKDGRLLAFGRGDAIRDKMPQSISSDMGKTWTYSPSPFPPIGGGQRLALLRLREGPILLVSFTDSSQKRKNGNWDQADGLYLYTRKGRKEKAFGMFAALSYDEGKSWPLKKLLTSDEGSVEVSGGGHTRTFILDRTHAEPMGYLAITQAPDGTIHLISSANHYRFNLAWLEQNIKD